MMPAAAGDADALNTTQTLPHARDGEAREVQSRAGAERVATWVVPLVLGLLVILGFVLRVAGSRTEEPIGRELLSLLGAQMVAEHLIPLLPSGVLYLHGTIYSFLLAPFVALGLSTPADIPMLRLISAATSTIAILLTYRLARFAQAAVATSLLAAAFVAIDPVSVYWGGHVRMYALAQPFAVATALVFLQAISSLPRYANPGAVRRRTLIALVVLFWLTVFTHLATALLWPAMVGTAVVIYGKSLLRERRDLTLALACCLLAPLVLVLLTGAIGPGAGTAISSRSEGLPGVSFLGEDNVNLSQILEPDPSPWTTLFSGGPLTLLAPLLMAIASGLLIGRYLTRPVAASNESQARSVGGLLALYWVPILALSMFATDAADRYAAFLMPTGYVLFALAAEALIAPAWGDRGARWSALGGAALVAVLLIHSAVGSAGLEKSQSGEEPESGNAEAYVSAHRQPGDLILTTSSVDSAQMMGYLPELRYLPGGEGSQRALRYTRYADDGHAIDYWIGMPSLNTTQALCSTLRESPGSWIVVISRIWDNWGYNDLPTRQMERRAEGMRELINGTADKVYEDDEQMVFRSRPVGDWSDNAQSICKESGG